MSIYLGLDVHSKQTSFCVEDETGAVLAEGSVDTMPEDLGGLASKLQARQPTRAALETGTQARWVYGLLVQAGVDPVVVDAAEVRQKARRRGQKSDRRDAFEICDGLRRNQWTRLVWMPDAKVQCLRQILSRRRHFVRLATSQINAARYLMRHDGRRLTTKQLVTQTAWLKLLRQPGIEHLLPYLRMHHHMWQMARQTVDALEDRLDQALAPFDSRVKLLCTMPGIGRLSAATYIACIGDPKRFATSGQVASYLGLVPSTYDSSDTQRHGRITRAGSRATRSVLVEIAHLSRHPNNPLNPYKRLLTPRKGEKRAVVAIAARIARILWRMLLTNRAFDLNRLNVERKPLRRSTTYPYQLRRPPPSSAA